MTETCDVPALEVDVDRDLVVLALPSRQPRLAIPMERAYDVAAEVRKKAKAARSWLEAGGLGTIVYQQRAYAVGGRGETVYIVFDVPTDRLKLPPKAAEHLAGLLEVQARNVAYKLAYEYAYRYTPQHQKDPYL